MTSFSILQITDLHIMPGKDDTVKGINTEYYFNAVLEQAFSENNYFDLILVSGDLAQDPCPDSYQRILNKIKATNTLSICLPGNHDDYKLMLEIFNTDKVSCQKQLLLENWQLICLNSQILGGYEVGRLSKQELLFLEDCLINHPNQHVLIAVHHHCLATQSAWLDTMIIENNEAFLNIIARYPQIKAVTCGHIHQEMDIKMGALRFFGTPSSCFQFKPKSETFSMDETPPGYRIIKLHPDGLIDTEIRRLLEPIIGLQIDTQGY